MTLALTIEGMKQKALGKTVISNMAKGNPQIDKIIKQHPDNLRKEEIRAEEKKKDDEARKHVIRARAPFEGCCTSMNRNESHPKTFRKTARALLKV